MIGTARFAYAAVCGLAAASGASAQLDITHQWVTGVGSAGTNDSVAAVSVRSTQGVYAAVNFEDAVPRSAGFRHVSASAATIADFVFTPQPGSEVVTHDILAVDPSLPRDNSTCDTIQSDWGIVGGSYVGNISFHNYFGPPITVERAGYALVAHPNAGGGMTPVFDDAALVPVEPNSAAEVLSIATGAPCIACAEPPQNLGAGAGGAAAAAGPTTPPPKSAPYQCLLGVEWVALAGYFRGKIDFDNTGNQFPIRTSNSGSEDAYVSIRSIETLATRNTGTLELHLSSAGDERITGIDGSEHSDRIAVTGHFNDPSLNFDPHSGGSPVTAPSHSGDADMFVAVYDFNFNAQAYVLKWVYTFGGPGFDTGTGVAFDSMDNVYVTGYFTDHLTGKRDIWMAKVSDPINPPLSGLLIPDWEFVIGDDGDDAGLDVTVDHLDRPVFSGQFGRPWGESGPQYCLDFDGTAGTAFVCSEGGLDGFVARYHPSGALDWAYQLGAAYDESVRGVDANRRYGGRLASGGSFGMPSAPPGYQVDFHPAVGGTDLLATQGLGDGFVSALDPTLPATSRSQIAIVVNNDLLHAGDWAEFVKDASDHIKLSGVVPHDGETVITVLVTGADEFGGAGYTGPLIPWTPFTSETAALFAQRLANTSQPAPLSAFPTNHLLSSAVYLAGQEVAGNGVAGGYRSILLATEQPEYGGPASLQMARDFVLDNAGGHASAQVDQINVLAAGFGFTSGPPLIDRDYALDNAVDSIEDVPNPAPEDNLGFAAELTAGDGMGLYAGFLDPQLHLVLRRMFQRMSFCPGDYNRMNGLDPNDPFDFDADSSNSVPYADWNFDGSWDGHVPGGLDREKFNVGYLMVPCP